MFLFQAVTELESMQDQMETFSGMLNRLQKKSENEIEDMRARLSVNGMSDANKPAIILSLAVL